MTKNKRKNIPSHALLIERYHIIKDAFPGMPRNDIIKRVAAFYACKQSAAKEVIEEWLHFTKKSGSPQGDMAAELRVATSKEEPSAPPPLSSTTEEETPAPTIIQGEILSTITEDELEFNNDDTIEGALPPLQTTRTQETTQPTKNDITTAMTPNYTCASCGAAYYAMTRPRYCPRCGVPYD